MDIKVYRIKEKLRLQKMKTGIENEVAANVVLRTPEKTIEKDMNLSTSSCSSNLSLSETTNLPPESSCIVCKAKFQFHRDSANASLDSMKRLFCNSFESSAQVDLVKKSKYPFCKDCSALLTDLCRREVQLRSCLDSFKEGKQVIESIMQKSADSLDSSGLSAARTSDDLKSPITRKLLVSITRSPKAEKALKNLEQSMVKEQDVEQTQANDDELLSENQSAEIVPRKKNKSPSSENPGQLNNFSPKESKKRLDFESDSDDNPPSIKQLIYTKPLQNTTQQEIQSEIQDTDVVPKKKKKKLKKSLLNSSEPISQPVNNFSPKESKKRLDFESDSDDNPPSIKQLIYTKPLQNTTQKEIQSEIQDTDVVPKKKKKKLEKSLLNSSEPISQPVNNLSPKESKKRLDFDSDSDDNPPSIKELIYTKTLQNTTKQEIQSEIQDTDVVPKKKKLKKSLLNSSEPISQPVNNFSPKESKKRLDFESDSDDNPPSIKQLIYTKPVKSDKPKEILSEIQDTDVVPKKKKKKLKKSLLNSSKPISQPVNNFSPKESKKQVDFDSDSDDNPPSFKELIYTKPLQNTTQKEIQSEIQSEIQDKDVVPKKKKKKLKKSLLNSSEPISQPVNNFNSKESMKYLGFDQDAEIVPKLKKQKQNKFHANNSQPSTDNIVPFNNLSNRHSGSDSDDNPPPLKKSMYNFPKIPMTNNRLNTKQEIGKKQFQTIKTKRKLSPPSMSSDSE